jgi:hypothetical protein
MSETEHRPRLGDIIEALHDSDVNGSVAWIFDGAWRVTIGDELSGVLGRGHGQQCPGSRRMASRKCDPTLPLQLIGEAIPTFDHCDKMNASRISQTPYSAAALK